MPMQANGPMTVGIRPADRPQQTGKSGAVERRGDGSASTGFSPRTDVAIKTAVNDMAGILSKISASSEEPVDAMPKELQQVIDNVLKQAFSYSETLGRGLGSTMESQRFSMDQLESFARMLFQLSSLSEKGYTVDIPDSLSMLLQSLKGSVGQATDQQLEPVILAKVAFALLDNPPEEVLPKEVQSLLATLSQGGQSTQPIQGTGGDSLAFLKKLVDFFMPRPSAENAGGEAQTLSGRQQGTNASGSTGGGQTLQNGTSFPQGGQQATKGTFTPESPQSNGNASGASTQGAQPQQSPQGNGPAGQLQNTQQGNGQSAPGSGTQQGEGAQGTGQGTAAPQQMARGTLSPQFAGQGQLGNGNSSGQGTPLMQMARGAAPQQPSGTNAQAMVQQNGQGNATSLQLAENSDQQAARGSNTPSLTAAMQQAKAALMNEPLENSPQMLQSLKNLASQLLQDNAVSGQATQLLQSFVNGKESVLSEKDARQLQLLIRVCQQNVPATVQQAAIQQNLPDLPRLWAFMQLCDMTAARKMSTDQLKKAGKDVALFIHSMKGSMGGDNLVADGTRSMNFMLPIFFGGVDKYPAYIHVYDENTRDRYTGELRKETWLRICMLTESIGAVELTSRVFNGDQLDMRVFFSDKDAADAFREDLQNVRRSLRGSKLKLHDFEVNATGERRFL